MMNPYEKSKVNQLGTAIGYGNVMSIASECWKEHMQATGNPTGGVFAIVCQGELDNLRKENAQLKKDITLLRVQKTIIKEQNQSLRNQLQAKTKE